ncbi:MAG: selenide, water dikinase SelD [Planctomycetota bacterium]|nr:selenide, water dikinase SelD [Planctomycetota bacterium]
MQTLLPTHDVVLLGIGHTNAHILRMWKMHPIADARLTCISNYSIATYSGMLPGALAGQYRPEQMEIDLVRLCASVGTGAPAAARLIVDTVTGLDVDRQEVMFGNRASIRFDVLSIGIGSVPTRAGVESLDDTVLAIKPMQTFLQRLEERLRLVHQRHPERPLRIAIVGAGAGGVEIALCLPNRIRKTLGEIAFELSIVNGRDEVTSGATAKTSLKARRALAARGVRLVLGRRAVRIADGIISLDDGQQVDADLVLWATSAVAPALLERFDLPKDGQGFLLTHATLRSTRDVPVFAVGDTGTIENSLTPKAGVYAVRQGMVLWENIQRTLRGQPLEEYRPQRNFLKLFNTGDGRAIGEYKGLSFHTRWAWRLKNAIDTKFMAKYQNYAIMPMAANPAWEDAAVQMRCAGCGGKVGGSVLSKVLARLDIPSNENVLLGLEAPDDAAIIRAPEGRPMTVTVDFFAAPLDDPYVVGRIAALNSASDVFALGAQPFAALASATIPVGKPRQQEQLLYEVLAGGLHEFRQMGATLVGGHTIEGPQLTVGFTMLASQGPGAPLTKAGLRVGDRLILTKPLGTGVLLAAHMQARCEARWMDTLLPTMLLSNQPAAQLVNGFDILGLTDVTGFGLAGHLLEMLRASNASAELLLDQIPLLAGVGELVSEGIESTLGPANRAVEANIRVTERQRRDSRYASLFDPQTSGGLLLGVRESQVDAVLSRLAELSDVPAAVIGDVVESVDREPSIKIARGEGPEVRSQKPEARSQKSEISDD